MICNVSRSLSNVDIFTLQLPVRAADFRDDAGAQVPTARDDDSDLDTPPATPGGLPERIHRSPVSRTETA